MYLTIYEDKARTIPLMQFVTDEDGSLRVFLKEPMNVLHFLPEERELVKSFLNIA